MKYSKYRLAKLEGSKWNDISALLGERGITSSGKIGAGFALGLVALVAYTIPSEEAGTIPPFAPLFLVVGFGFGIFAYFSQWVLGLILSGVSTKILPHRDQTFRESGKLLAALKQLYTKWKNHDYRS